MRPDRVTPGPDTTTPRDVADALDRVREALRGLAFGTITVTVQDGVVVQIDRTEKLRLDRARGR